MVRRIRFGDLVRFSPDVEPTECARRLMEEYSYFDVDVERGYYTTTVRITDGEATVMVVLPNFFSDYAFVVEAYGEVVSYLVVPRKLLDAMVVATVGDDGALFVGLDSDTIARHIVNIVDILARSSYDYVKIRRHGNSRVVSTTLTGYFARRYRVSETIECFEVVR